MNPFLLFFSVIALSGTFLAISYCRKNACFFCRTIIWETFSPALSIVTNFTFLNEPCQLFISKEWNHPVTLLCRSPWFYEGKGDGGRLTTTVYDSPTTFKFKLFNISHLLEVVVIWRKKIIGMDPDSRELSDSPNFLLNFQKLTLWLDKSESRRLAESGSHFSIMNISTNLKPKSERLER
jgi:hypothetical protein